MKIFVDNWILALRSLRLSLACSQERGKIEMFLLSVLFATPAVKISVCFGNVNFAATGRRRRRGLPIITGEGRDVEGTPYII